MIKAFAITDKGIEKTALLELDELIKSKGTSDECVALFECKDYDELMKFCYLSQSIQRAMVLLASFDFATEQDLLSKSRAALKTIKLQEWLSKGSSFKVNCERRGEHKFGSQGIEQEIGEQVLKEAKQQLGFTPDVSMENPDTIFYVFINNNKAYIGIDFVGRDLSKRKYRIFSAPGIINANLAYALARMSNYSRKEKTVELFCKAGVICIEAALYASGKSVNHYSKDFAFKKLKPLIKKDWDAFFKDIDAKAKEDKLDILGLDPLLRNVEASKRNAKLAGIDKLINFSRMDTEWLDTKIDKASVGSIVSKVPCPSKHAKEPDVRKLYKELFYQADFIMKKGGRITLLGENLALLKSMIIPGFKLKKEEEIWAGKQRYEAVIIEKL
ncbi:hypothetical protein JXB28_00905 [Candidatus Woesearchaeota archaeon]|nr:hypothetical protein [Candidatus Woesearchaeota archaeon]